MARAAAAALLLRPGGADAAAYAPGAPEVEPTAVGPLDGAPPPPSPPSPDTGIRWGLAPIRLGGSVSLDTRWMRLEDGRRTTQALVYNDIQAATHVWEPWFVQLRAGLGVLAAQDTSRLGNTEATRTHSTALTGHVGVSVFPLSRFPFELRAEMNDSRARGDHLGTDYRLQRVSLSQAWRPENGNDSLNLHLDHSRLRTTDGSQDTVSSLQASALHQVDAHAFELSAQLTDNTRSDTDDRSRIGTLSARHTFQPAEPLHVDTLATWNEVRLRSGLAAGSGGRFDSNTDIRQISSFATWRPAEGDWLYSAASPLHLTGSVRLLDAGTDAGGAAATAVTQRLRAVNASLGASQELTREWRLAGALSATQLEPAAGARTTLNSGNASLSYTPDGLMLGAWRYTPSVSTSLGVSRSSETGERHTQGLQLSHGASRTLMLGDFDSVSFNLTQSLGALHDSQAQRWTRALAHSAGVYWQGAGTGASQSYASLSVSDSRTLSDERGVFQLVNLQLSRRTEVSRHASWSGNLTAQASRSDTTQLDPFTALLREAGPGWQRFYSGSLSYEQQRLWGVPRLRYTALLTVSSQQLDSRAAGDIEALRERVTESIENRLDYSIGRLELRLSARAARIEGRDVALLYARALRRY